MTTIQPPPAPDANTAISAFSTSARQTFDDFLEANSSRYRITREKRSVGKEKLDRLGIEPRTPTKANGRSTTELPALQVCRRSVEPQIPTLVSKDIAGVWRCPFDLTPFVAFGMEGLVVELKSINSFIKMKLDRIVDREMVASSVRKRTGWRRGQWV